MQRCVGMTCATSPSSLLNRISSWIKIDASCAAFRQSTAGELTGHSVVPHCLQDDLVFLRVRTKKHEVMVAPDKEYLLIVVQNPTPEESK